MINFYETEKQKRENPCYQCTERHEACHDTCTRYKIWAEKQAKIKEARRKFYAVRQHPWPNNTNNR